MDAISFKHQILPHYTEAYQTALSIVRNTDDARDITQELFRRLWEKHDDTQMPSSPKAFIIIASRNASLSWLRANNPANTEPVDQQLADTTADDTDDNRDINATLLHKAINQLDSRGQEIINMTLAGETNENIAVSLGLSVGNVRQIICRARSRLRQKILDMQQQL